MDKLIAYGLPGLFTGAAYAIAASGLVLTYTTTRVFNIAHGAFGMVMAFVFWDFSQRQDLPVWLSLFLVLAVVAPATGWFVQRFITRGLGEAPVGVGLVVTVGLFVGLIGLAQQIWPPDARFVPPFFAETTLRRRTGGDHRPPADHDPRVAPGRRRPLPAAQPDPDRHRDAGLGRQPRPAAAVRRSARPDRGPVLGDRHLALGPGRHPAGVGGRPGLLPAHAPGHQRVRRRDDRPAAQPAAHLRRRDGARRCSTPWRSATSRPTARSPTSGR